MRISRIRLSGKRFIAGLFRQLRGTAYRYRHIASARKLSGKHFSTLTAQYIKKRRDKCVLFLDDCFDADEAPAKLIAAGFCQVELFVTHFPDSRDETKKQFSVKDPRILRLCSSKGWLLVTTDGAIRYTHVEEIKKCSSVAILATANNTGDTWIRG